MGGSYLTMRNTTTDEYVPRTPRCVSPGNARLSTLQIWPFPTVVPTHTSPERVPWKLASLPALAVCHLLIRLAPATHPSESPFLDLTLRFSAVVVYYTTLHMRT